MNRLVKSFKIFAAMSDHGLGEGSESFRRDLDRTGREKLIVRKHRGERSTLNAQRPTLNAEKRTPQRGVLTKDVDLIFR